MKRALTLGLMLLTTAVSAADLQLATRHDELRALDVAPSRASSSRKVQWAPSGNFSALHARAVFGSETETASRPYAREEDKTAAGAGIFLSRDSFEGSLNSAPSLHRFAYANDNPLRYRDLTGHCWAVPGSGEVACMTLYSEAQQQTIASFYRGVQGVKNELAANDSFTSAVVGGLPPAQLMLWEADAAASLGVVAAGKPGTVTDGESLDAFNTVNMLNPVYSAATHGKEMLEIDTKAKSEGGYSLETGGQLVEKSLQFAVDVTATYGAARGGATLTPTTGVTTTGLWAEMGRSAPPVASIAAESFSLTKAAFSEFEPYNPSVASMNPRVRAASYTTKLINGDFVEVPEGMAVPPLVRSPSASGLKSGVPGPGFQPGNVTTDYVRPSAAGPTAAQRASVQGRPCVDCGAITPKQVADHRDPLSVEHFRTGKIDVKHQASLEAVQPHCPTCSSVQGGQLSGFVRTMRELLGL